MEKGDPGTEGELWSRLISLMPVVESFTLEVQSFMPTLGLDHIKLFNASTLHVLEAELRISDFGSIDQFEKSLRLVLPSTCVSGPRLEHALKAHAASQLVEEMDVCTDAGLERLETNNQLVSKSPNAGCRPCRIPNRHTSAKRNTVPLQRE